MLSNLHFATYRPVHTRGPGLDWMWMMRLPGFGWHGVQSTLDRVAPPANHLVLTTSSDDSNDIFGFAAFAGLNQGTGKFAEMELWIHIGHQTECAASQHCWLRFLV
jgi:hypothetical protein